MLTVEELTAKEGGTPTTYTTDTNTQTEGGMRHPQADAGRKKREDKETS